MKKILVIATLLISLNSSAQLRVFAGNDTTLCADCILNGTAQLGTTMKVQGGTPPYYYVWSVERVETWAYYPDYSSQCLSSNTSPTPYLKEVLNNGRYYPFVLTVIDANYNRAKDTIMVQFSQVYKVYNPAIVYPTIGEEIILNPENYIYGGIKPYHSFSWTPKDGLATPDSFVTKCKVQKSAKYVLSFVDSKGCKVQNTIYDVRAQSIPPFYLGSTDVWNYRLTKYSVSGSTHPSPDAYYNLTYYLNGDTVIGGANYKKLYQNDAYSSKSYSGYFCGVRESEGKWYFLIPGNDESVMYDFSKNKGDTISLGGGNTMLKVDSIGIINYNGHSRKQFFLTNYRYGIAEVWIEGIGNIYHFLHGYFFYGERYNMMCYHRNNELIYMNPLFDTCQLPDVGFETPTLNNELLIRTSIASPSDFQLKSSNEITSIFVYNTQGKIVKLTTPFSNDATVSLAVQPKGIYVVRVSTADGVFVRKIMKK
ncbi:MAG: T9SS type A sorting domain-containing protein [Bacteroidales bacterium]